MSGVKLSTNLHMEVHGRTSQEALAAFYERADISVLPTLGDEWGVVVNESLSAGRPVLGSVHSQAVTELIREGLNGWTWDPEEEGALHHALTRVFATSVEELTAMSAECRQSVTELSPRAVASRVLQALHDLDTELRGWPRDCAPQSCTTMDQITPGEGGD